MKLWRCNGLDCQETVEAMILPDGWCETGESRFAKKDFAAWCPKHWPELEPISKRRSSRLRAAIRGVLDDYAIRDLDLEDSLVVAARKAGQTQREA